MWRKFQNNGSSVSCACQTDGWYFRAILREIESSNLEHCFGVDSGLSGQTFGTQLRRGNVMMIHSPFTIQIPKILTWSTGIF